MLFGTSFKDAIFRDELTQKRMIIDLSTFIREEILSMSNESVSGKRIVYRLSFDIRKTILAIVLNYNFLIFILSSLVVYCQLSLDDR